MTTTIEKFAPGQVDTAAVLKTLNLDPRSPQTQALLLVCERYELDPLLKHMVLIQGSPYVTRDGYLAIAHRSGLFDGMEVIEQSETSSHYVAKVAVYRKDWGRPVTMVGRYPKQSRMAKDYGPEMAVKVAEVAALRRAFNVTGVGAADERFDDEAKPQPVTREALEPAAPPVPIDTETGEIVDAEIVEKPEPKRRVRKPPVAVVPPAEEPTPEQQKAQVEKARESMLTETQNELRKAIEAIKDAELRRTVKDDLRATYKVGTVAEMRDEECEIAIRTVAEHVKDWEKSHRPDVHLVKTEAGLYGESEAPFTEDQPTLDGGDAA